MIVDHIQNWNQYSLGEAWEKAFRFLQDLSPEAEEKEYPIDGDAIFARVMSYQTERETKPGKILEAHRKYADIQMALIDSERIAVYPTHSLASKGPYAEDRDVEFFEYKAPAKLQLSMTPGTFALLLPQDAHMPGLFTEAEGAKVKKVVVKILLERLKL
ncbi:YhcH/YjgK/YiaL family protein [Pelagicoccus sp. NFK12]|uniref:YhcH/YjgK/YiaL family protein n=1 Tax=Pelagicoccus enzymogenes TaxID=2773457 RepID=A0A927FB67_9BACT|nr:YhcH/YjgK/YiaL family protein [Pelagicoccus enzymogenes]MBD5781883.1 YhcH/YjgK/YiaL family protein [Pelagicoccus enzymogenes]